MNLQTLSAGAGIAVLATAPVVPGAALFLLACYGLGSAAGQLLALALGVRFPGVKDGRIAAALGLVGLLFGLVTLLVGAIR